MSAFLLFVFASGTKIRDVSVEDKIAFAKDEIGNLLKARQLLQEKQSVFSSRFKEDERFINVLLDEKRLIDAPKDEEHASSYQAVSGVKTQLSMLANEKKIYEQQGKKEKQIAYLDSIVKNLEDAEEDILPPPPQKAAITQQINSIAAEGKDLHQQLGHLGKEVKAIESQIQLLKQEETKLQENEEDAPQKSQNFGGNPKMQSDLEVALKSHPTSDSVSYEEESARDLSRALGKGWEEEKLDRNAAEAENSFHSALGGGGALKSLEKMLSTFALR